MHIKYTKSTQRQKRLVSSRKISYKIFALPSLFLLFFYLFSFLLFKFSPSRKANLSLIFGTENAIVDPSLRRRERDARAITIYFIYFFYSPRTTIFVSLFHFYFFFFLNIVVTLCRLRKAPNRGLLARLEHRIPHEEHMLKSTLFVLRVLAFNCIYKKSRRSNDPFLLS